MVQQNMALPPIYFESIGSFYFSHFLPIKQWTIFGSIKFEEKYERKKITSKGRRKKKLKKNKKIDLKSINYFYILF